MAFDIAWFKLRDLLVSQFRHLVVNGAGWRFGVPVAEQQGYFFDSLSFVSLLS